MRLTSFEVLRKREHTLLNFNTTNLKPSPFDHHDLNSGCPEGLYGMEQNYSIFTPRQ